MRIILRKPANSHQPMQRSGQFGSIARSQFGITKRQIAVRMLRRFVDTNMERTVHRLQPELGLFQLSRGKHDVGVILFVSADPPQIALRDVRCIDQPIPSLREFSAKIVLHLSANRATLRMPQHETLPVILLNRKQIKLAAESTMVALLSFFALLEPPV